MAKQSSAQVAARERNWSKFYLSGVKTNLLQIRPTLSLKAAKELDIILAHTVTILNILTEESA